MKLYLIRFLQMGTWVSTILLIGSVLLQIVARFLLDSAPSWTEEASRLFFIYAIAFASGLALRDNHFVYMDTFYEKFPSGMKRQIQRLIPLVTWVMFGLIAYYSLDFVRLGIGEFSPSMQIPMAIAFLSMGIMSASLCYFSFWEWIASLKKQEL